MNYDNQIGQRLTVSAESNGADKVISVLIWTDPAIVVTHEIGSTF